MNGKGVCYHKTWSKNESKKIFEGLFEDGKYKGKGIVYHYNGEKELEGTFTNGEIEGVGKEYHWNGKLKY